MCQIVYEGQGGVSRQNSTTLTKLYQSRDFTT